MARRVTALSSKGGVGKTTNLANLGAVLADMGARVLLCDADIQPALSKHYPLEYEAPKGIVEVFAQGWIDQECISRTSLPRLHLIKSNDGKAQLQHWLYNRADQRTRLKGALAAPLIDDNYDFVLIDTQGAIGPVQTAAAFAAHTLISPLPPDSQSIREFATGTLQVLKALEHSDTEPTALLAPLHVLISKDRYTRNAKALLNAVRSEFKESDEVRFLSTVVPDAVAYNEAATLQVPVHMHNRVSGQRILSAFEVMHRLAWELFPELYGWFAGGVKGDPDQVFAPPQDPTGGEIADEAGGEQLASAGGAQ